MTKRVLEAVPNFSEGRNTDVIEPIVDAFVAAGADVLDWSADPDHNRTVVTFVGPPEVVEEAAVAGAAVALGRIDLRQHQGVHPRVGAIDVLPFVPLSGLTLEDARASARRVGRVLTDELGVPVSFYAHASDPPGRRLAELRRGGFEGLAHAWPADRHPDLLPPGWSHPGAHPSAGMVCVGARPLMLAWNVAVEDLGLEDAARIAADIRERGDGFAGLRALALELPTRQTVQISMNLEDLEATSPIDILRRIEQMAADLGGRVIGAEVIGMVPDELVLSAADERLRTGGLTTRRLLSRRLAEHLAGRT